VKDADLALEVGVVSLIFIIIAFDCIPIPNKRIKHERCIHQGFITRKASSDILIHLQLGWLDNALRDMYSTTVDAVRAFGVYG
jgi:hypothetical protein